jgi:hypothetical protein
MGCIWNIVRRQLQDGSKNSDAPAPAATISEQKFSALESGENFIRQDLVQIGPNQETSCRNRWCLLSSATTLALL